MSATRQRRQLPALVPQKEHRHTQKTNHSLLSTTAAAKLQEKFKSRKVVYPKEQN